MSFSMPLLMKHATVVPSIPTGNMWTSNITTNTYYKISPTGVKTTYTNITNPYSSVVNDGTNMWFANYVGNKIYKRTPAGVITSYTVPTPYGTAFDGTCIWTSNGANNSVSKITLAGVVTTYAVGINLNGKGIAFDGTNMWVTSLGGNSISKILPDGTVGGTYIVPTPTRIAFDGTNMWVTSGNSVKKILPDGTVGGTYVVNSPTSICFDGTNMWTYNYRAYSEPTGEVSKIAPDGTVTTYNNSLRGLEPQGLNIAFDGVYIWIGSYNNSRVSKIDLNGNHILNVSSVINCTGLSFDGCLLSHWWGGS